MKNKYYVIIGVLALLLACNNIGAYPTISGLTNGESWRMVSLCNDSTVPKNCSTTHYFQGLEYATESLDQYQNATHYQASCYANIWQGHVFIPDYEEISKVKVWLRKVGTPTGNFTLRIVREKFGIPDMANVHATSVIWASNISTTAGWVEFDFTDFTYNPSYGLVIVMNLTGGDLNNNIKIEFEWYNPYPDGTLVRSVNNGVDWTIYSSYDVTFQSYGYNSSSTMYNRSWDNAVTNNILNNTLFWWNHSTSSYLNVTHFTKCRGYWVYLYDVNYTFLCNVSDTDKSMDANDTVNLSLDCDSWVNLTWYSWFNDSVTDTLETILSINNQYINTTVCVDDSFSGIFYFNYTGFEIGYNSSHNYYWNDTNNTFWVNSEHLNFTVTKEILPFFLTGIVFSGCLFYFVSSNKKPKQKKKESYME